jgi:hypothetical protein
LVTEVDDVALVEEEGGPTRASVRRLEEIGTSLACAGDEDERMLLGYDWWSESLDVDLTNLVLSSNVAGLYN